jgi:uncharacterized phage protein (TIGR01671 family)
MRDIKFRAWNLIDKSMVDWCSIKYSFDTFIKSKHYQVMQFTGLQDEKSIDIYNDDICYVEGHGNCLVKTCVYYGVTFVNAEGSEVSAIDCMPDGDAFTVIGNIHQNPELLENK